MKAVSENIASRDPDREAAEIQIRAALVNRINALGLPTMRRGHGVDHLGNDKAGPKCGPGCTILPVNGRASAAGAVCAGARLRGDLRG